MDMDNVLDHEAVPVGGGPRRGRAVRLAATSAVVLVVAASVLVHSEAYGQQQPGQFRRAERPGVPVGNGLAHRQSDQRSDGLPARQAGYPGPMSPEERRQLRRDIDEHGRDLYKDRRDPR